MTTALEERAVFASLPGLGRFVDVLVLSFGPARIIGRRGDGSGRRSDQGNAGEQRDDSPREIRSAMGVLQKTFFPA